MGQPELVPTAGAVLPETIRISQGMSLSPNEMRTLKEMTGRTLTDLLGGDLEDMDSAPDRIQSLVWVQLRRLGYDGVSWDDAGDVIPEFGEPEPDPTNGERSKTSPPSATSGT